MAPRPTRVQFPDLVECATKVFIRQGYRRTQMEDVARELGVAKGTLYLYVASKEALFFAALVGAIPGPVEWAPTDYPIQSPDSDTLLGWIRESIDDAVSLPTLRDALQQPEVEHPRDELRAILEELYDLLYANRIVIKLIDRCSVDFPELGKIWFSTARVQEFVTLMQYFDARIQAGHLRSVPDLPIATRIVLETLAFWAIHRHWDPSPQAFDSTSVKTSAVEILVRFFT